MSDKSNIEWTDATWNPVRGCTKVSPGCKNCYAEAFAERFRGVAGHPYEQGFDLRLVAEKIDEPLSWKRPRRVFVNSMSDLFQDGIPDQYISQVCVTMQLAPQHTYQILTKRHERLFDYLSARPMYAMLPNVWWGVSAEDRKYGLPRVESLRRSKARNRFVSFEPLLEDLGTFDLSGIRWGIVGGESGHGARPCSVEWVRSLVAQCKAAGVPCFVKQLGARPITKHIGWTDHNEPFVDGWPDDVAWTEPGDGFAHPILSDRKGGDMSEWPEDLRIRQFPSAE